jgi:hypothetical protein
MTILYVEPQQQANEIMPLVRSAIESQIVKLELALKLADLPPSGSDGAARVPT